MKIFFLTPTEEVIASELNRGENWVWQINGNELIFNELSDFKKSVAFVSDFLKVSGLWRQVESRRYCVILYSAAHSDEKKMTNWLGRVLEKNGFELLVKSY
jgi:hypothetical protein